MDVDKPPSVTHQALNPVPMEVDQEVEEEATKVLKATNVIAVAPPTWLTACNMDVYLQKCSNEKVWRN